MADISELSKSDLIAAFTSKRLEDNLLAFKEHMPHIYQTFEAYQEERFFLIYDSDGSINLLDREEGLLLYGDNPVEEILNNYEGYRKKAIHRPYFMGNKTTPIKVNPVHTDAMAAIGKIQLELMSNLSVNGKFMQSGPFLLQDDVYGVLPDVVNSFYCFSIGLGFDIERLYLDYEIRKFFLAELNSDVFYASMQLIDWKAMLEKANREKYNLYIGITDDGKELVRDMVSHAMTLGRHNSAGAYVYSAFYRPEYSNIFSSFQDALYLNVFSGYGFYDDSRLSIAHTVSNFNNKVPCIKSDASINKKFGQSDYPVFIIGNGPSLDSDLAFIKENQDNVVIVSCGTSLKALYSYGIVPDFHAELERTAHIPHWIKNGLDDPQYRDYLKKIRIVGMSQVHPEAYKLFGMAGQMPKDTETGSLIVRTLFADRGVSLIARCGPSCVHVGVTASILLGFKDIYLFGVDMGYKSLNKHHSDHSSYSELNEEAQKRFSVKEKKQNEIESNFGDEVTYSSGLLPMFKDQLENVITGWNQTFQGSLNVYNCSDGARIEGADAMRSYDICMVDRAAGDKKELSDNLLKSYFAYIPDDDDVEKIKLFLEDSYDKVDLMVDWLKKHLVDVDSVLEGAGVVDSLSYHFHTELDEIGIKESDSLLFSLFDGTLLYTLSAIQSTLFSPVEERLRVEAFNEMMVVMRGLFDDIALDYRENALEADKEEYYDLFK